MPRSSSTFPVSPMQASKSTNWYSPITTNCQHHIVHHHHYCHKILTTNRQPPITTTTTILFSVQVKQLVSKFSPITNRQHHIVHNHHYCHKILTTNCQPPITTTILFSVIPIVNAIITITPCSIVQGRICGHFPDNSGRG